MAINPSPYIWMEMDYKRADLPVWVQGWLDTDKALVFIVQKTKKGALLVDGNARAKKALTEWTGLTIPTLEQIEEHKQADLTAWRAFSTKDLKRLASLVLYEEEIAGTIYETIKTPISDNFIVILTRPK